MELFKNILVKYMVENTVSKLSDKLLLELDLEDFKTYRELKDLEVGVDTQRALCFVRNRCKERRESLFALA
ncbi:hypothetical protein JTE90_019431 [Oedothorax gibbosus]|uniref:Uncharacterized protein n=1 Tax=Oedothorax gibbosus TaxID=931172 RepID=A0AAV6TV62_9ARAC|nr:hypothetical protein JTE90_019431 [Oedothorax gibbosus]